MESRTEKETQTYMLEITVSNTTSEQDIYQLEWYFIGRDAAGEDKPFLCEKGSKELTVSGRSKIQHSITSQPAISSETKNAGYSGDLLGFAYKGYVVLVKHGDTILAKEGSNSSFLKDKWLEKLNGSPSPLSTPEKKGGTEKRKNR